MRLPLILFALIASILCVSYPPAVFGTVVAIDIDPVNFQSSGIARSHVGDETQRIVPSTIHRYPATAVAMKPSGFVAIAAMHHGNPFSVNGIPEQAVRLDGIALQANATLHISTFKLVDASDVREFSARALADGDIAISPNALGNHSDSQPAEFLANGDGIGSERLKSEALKIKHESYPGTNYGLILAPGVIK